MTKPLGAMITAKVLTDRFGFPPRSARRLLSDWNKRGLATTVQTGGRPALAIDPDTAARLLGIDAADLAA